MIGEEHIEGVAGLVGVGRFTGSIHSGCLKHQSLVLCSRTNVLNYVVQV